MVDTTQEQNEENPTDRFPLLMEREDHENQHVIDIERVNEAPSSTSASDASHHDSHTEDRPSRSPRAPIHPSTSSSSSGTDSQSPTIGRRAEGLGRRRWSPFNSVLWVSVELLFTIGQIVAAIVVLSVSREEKPQTPLFAWIVGYAFGCAASLPLLYWRYLHRNQGNERGSQRVRQRSSMGETQTEPNSYVTISFARTSEEENGESTSTGTWNGLSMGTSSVRLNLLVDHFKMALDCFFAVWFVVGNVWIFGGNSSSSDAPNLYRLCLVFLTISCIGYAMPFILCGMICCCLPCIFSILGVPEDMNHVRGASEDSINALPTHKFKLKRNGNGECRDPLSPDEGGVVAVGTEKERAIAGEDAVCCICLARYTDNDLLRELPCSHFFHTECVDKWLKINASCPLCKSEIGNGGNEDVQCSENSNQ